MVLRFEYPATWSCQCGREHHVPLRKVLFEFNLLGRISEIVGELEIGRRCLIVEDRITQDIAGKRARQILESAGYRTDEVIVGRADDENAAVVRERLLGFDFSIAIGGGSPIDVTKIATYERGVPFVSFPTAMSHDGIASPIASITSHGVKRSVKAHPPLCVMADLGILLSAPTRMTAAGCGDLLAKLTSLKDWELGRDDRGEYYCERCAHLAFEASNDILGMKYPIESGEQAKNLADALVNSGVSMILADSSRPASGSEHLFSHYLDGNTTRPAMHGEQCALGTILIAKYHATHNSNWWTQSEHQWHNIKRTMEEAGLPSTARGLGIEENLATLALTEAAKIRPERYTILHKRPISRIEAENLLEETSVI